MTSYPKVLSLNANGIRNRKLEFFDYLLKKKIKVACICETKLNEFIRFKHTDFIIIRLDSNSGQVTRGGVAIVVHHSVPFETLPSLGTEIIEAIGIKIKLDGHHQFLKIISAYYTGTVADQDPAAFRRDIKRLTTLRNAAIFGDFNAKHDYWGCIRNNATGNILYEEMISADFDIVYPDEPTYHPGPSRYPSVLDIMLKTTPIHVESATVGDDLGSDHLPIIVEFDTELNTDSGVDLMYKFSKANWPLFKNFLQRHIDLKEFRLDANSTTTDIDNCITKLTSLLMEATELAVPKTKRYHQNSQMTTELDALIKLRRAKRRQYQRNGHHLLRREVELLKQRIEYLSSQIQNSEFQNWISTFEPNKDHNKKLFSLSRLLRGKKSSIPVLEGSSGPLITDAEKAEAFANRFLSNHLTTTDDSAPPEIEEAVDECIRLIDNHTDPNLDPQTLTTPKEVRNIIRGLRNNKAPGFDGVRNDMVKNGGKKLVTALTYIINACLILSYFPSNWKHAITTPVKKPGKSASDSASYRGVSLLSVLSKIFERVILQRFLKHIEENHLLPDFQFGFRAGHSTTQQIARVIQLIRSGFQQQLSTGMVLLDLSCAFDSVWHEGLIFKMYQSSFPIYLVKLMRSFLKNRTFCVRVGKSVSRTQQIPAGVPQGAVLSAVSFNIFTSDVPQNNTTDIAQYADDIAISKTAKRADSIKKACQDTVNSFSSYFKRWKLKLNHSKSEAAFFTKRTAQRAYPKHKITINGHEVPWKETTKYLGVHLDKRLTFKHHTDSLVESSGVSIKMLYSLLCRSSQLHTRNKTLIFKTIIRPRITYASPAWGNCALTHIRKLQVIQNRCLKMCHNLPYDYPTTDLHELARVEMLEHHINRQMNAFWLRCQLSDNPLIQNLRQP